MDIIIYVLYPILGMSVRGFHVFLRNNIVRTQVEQKQFLCKREGDRVKALSYRGGKGSRVPFHISSYLFSLPYPLPRLQPCCSHCCISSTYYSVWHVQDVQ